MHIKCKHQYTTTRQRIHLLQNDKTSSPVHGQPQTESNSRRYRQTLLGHRHLNQPTNNQYTALGSNYEATSKTEKTSLLGTCAHADACHVRGR